MTEAIDTLLRSGQYAPAKQLLDQRAGSSDFPPDLRIDLAMADLHVSGAQSGLDALNGIPQFERNGDYYLARAQMLAAQNKPQDAEVSIQQAIHANPTRPELYRQAALLLIEDRQLPKALELLAQAARTVPNNPEILLLQALTLELAGSHGASDKGFEQLENRWPEWYKVWIGNALILEARQKDQEAAGMRQAAVALGAPSDIAELGEHRPFSDAEIAGVLPVLFP
jgi:tetratricopeptide (TPR) repeat protein